MTTKQLFSSLEYSELPINDIISDNIMGNSVILFFIAIIRV